MWCVGRTFMAWCEAKNLHTTQSKNIIWKKKNATKMFRLWNNVINYFFFILYYVSSLLCCICMLGGMVADHVVRVWAVEVTVTVTLIRLYSYALVGTNYNRVRRNTYIVYGYSMIYIYIYRTHGTRMAKPAELHNQHACFYEYKTILMYL